ncbi:MAG: glutathione S-transferase family protein [Alphaproteobacteria bacterium]|nr:glutathione S-transferase family protein [Alphaproteobacteria bacterium]MDP6563401.1 glutathione S-transferase family protein [Alphaproteobacteria bacterium]
MTLEIIGFPRSNFVRTVRMVAHEKGVDYEHNKAMPHSDEVKAIHPLGLIPVMRHDGLELAESQAIARYIDEAFEGPALIPAEPRAAAVVNRWIATTATSVDQLLMRQYVVEYAFHKDDDGNVVRTVIDRAIKRFPKMFGLLEAAVAPGYLGGEAFSMADCFLMPILAATRNFPEGQESFDGCANLKAYFDRVAERPSFVETGA